MPTSRIADHQQRGRDRPQDERARGAHRRRPLRRAARRASRLIAAAAAAPARCALRRRRAWRRRLPDFLAQHDLGAVAQLVGAVDHDLVARLRARSSPRRARRRCGPSLTVRTRDRVVGLHQIDEGAGRAALDRRGRHDDRVLAACRPAGATLTNWFGNSASSVLSNCARSFTVPVVGVDLVVDASRACRRRASSRCCGRRRSTGSVAPLLQPLHHRRQLVLGQGEDDGDRLHLRDHDEPLASPACT